MERYRSAATAAFLVFGLSLGGCATITSNEMQSLALTAKTQDGKEVKDVKCSARNDKGAWEASAPGFINVHRSAQDLIVECKKDGYSDGLLRAISRVAAGMFGNIIFGGGIGAIIDHTKGTGYNYPDNLPVKMGSAEVVDRRDETNTPGSGTPASVGGAQPGPSKTP